MAKTFQKTYQVTVTFVCNDGDADINTNKMSEGIKKGIGEACRRSMGVTNCYPGTVTET